MGAAYGRRAVIGVAAVLVIGSAAVPLAPTLAQDGEPATDGTAVVLTPLLGIHAGACARLSAEPVYELGEFRLEPVNLDELLDLRESAAVEDAGALLSEDDNDDRVLQPGEDRNGNGVIDEGVDEDGDGVLDPGEILPIQVPLPPVVYKAEAEIGASFDEFLAAPHAVAVHAVAAADDTVIACGEIAGPADGGQVVTALRPHNGSNYYGVAVFEQDAGATTIGATAFLFQGIDASRRERAATAQSTPTR